MRLVAGQPPTVLRATDPACGREPLEGTLHVLERDPGRDRDAVGAGRPAHRDGVEHPLVAPVEPVPRARRRPAHVDEVLPRGPHQLEHVGAGP